MASDCDIIAPDLSLSKGKSGLTATGQTRPQWSAFQNRSGMGMGKACPERMMPQRIPEGKSALKDSPDFYLLSPPYDFSQTVRQDAINEPQHQRNQKSYRHAI